ncbi:hypothetical protein [Gemmobacter nanjingensis]|uniref:hypothetical protein n=1 Tax=Gemmobacter nanjingensis TaxID=488454 RepID=UPI00167BEFAA|nr:hypothetical protein [Gemmobacter nanjingensis]
MISPLRESPDGSKGEKNIAYSNADFLPFAVAAFLTWRAESGLSPVWCRMRPGFSKLPFDQ